MNIEKIMTPNGVFDPERQELCEQLYRVANTDGWMPSLSEVMSMDKEKLGKFIETHPNVVIRYSWVSTPDGGWAEIRPRMGAMMVEVCWSESTAIEIRITNPSMRCLVMLGRTEARKFRFRIDGENYSRQYLGITL